jgi:hypothetical protein
MNIDERIESFLEINNILHKTREAPNISKIWGARCFETKLTCGESYGYAYAYCGIGMVYNTIQVLRFNLGLLESIAHYHEFEVWMKENDDIEYNFGEDGARIYFQEAKQMQQDLLDALGQKLFEEFLLLTDSRFLKYSNLPYLETDYANVHISEFGVCLYEKHDHLFNYDKEHALAANEPLFLTPDDAFRIAAYVEEKREELLQAKKILDSIPALALKIITTIEQIYPEETNPFVKIDTAIQHVRHQDKELDRLYSMALNAPFAYGLNQFEHLLKRAIREELEKR